MKEPKCDFCGASEVAWAYPAKSFVYDEISGSLGAWAACSECSDLIEAENHHALAKRSLDNAGPWVAQLTYGDYEDLLKGVKDVHNQFRSARTGERQAA